MSYLDLLESLRIIDRLPAWGTDPLNRHLVWLRDGLGPRFVRGIVLHTAAMTFPLGPRLWAMPIAALWRSV